MDSVEILMDRLVKKDRELMKLNRKLGRRSYWLNVARGILAKHGIDPRTGMLTDRFDQSHVDGLWLREDGVWWRLTDVEEIPSDLLAKVRSAGIDLLRDQKAELEAKVERLTTERDRQTERYAALSTKRYEVDPDVHGVWKDGLWLKHETGWSHVEANEIDVKDARLAQAWRERDEALERLAERDAATDGLWLAKDGVLTALDSVEAMPEDLLAQVRSASIDLLIDVKDAALAQAWRERDEARQSLIFERTARNEERETMDRLHAENARLMSYFHGVRRTCGHCHGMVCEREGLDAETAVAQTADEVCGRVPEGDFDYRERSEREPEPRDGG